MKKLNNIIITLTSLAMLSACVSQKSYNFREIAVNPYDLEGRRAQILMTNDKVIEMNVESVQGNHLYGDGKYVPISVIKSAKTTKRGLPEVGGPGGIQPCIRHKNVIIVCYTEHLLYRFTMYLA